MLQPAVGTWEPGVYPLLGGVPPGVTVDTQAAGGSWREAAGMNHTASGTHGGLRLAPVCPQSRKLPCRSRRTGSLELLPAVPAVGLLPTECLEFTLQQVQKSQRQRPCVQSRAWQTMAKPL